MAGRRRALKWGLGIAGAALILIVVMSINARDNYAATGTTSPPDEVGVTTEGPVPIGTTVERNSIALTAGPLKARNDPLGGLYLCSVITYNNHDDQVINFNGYFDWKFETPDGVLVTPSLNGFNDSLGSGAIRPGGKATGNICTDNSAKGQWRVHNTQHDVVWEGRY